MATTNPTLKSALEARLAVMSDGEGITPWTIVEEKLTELAEALVPYQLEPYEEMRESERVWFDRAVCRAAERALQAAERILVDELVTSWSESAPTTLIDHPKSEQLRADLGKVAVPA